MAEVVINPIVEHLLSYLGSIAFGEIALIYGVEEEIHKIKDTFSAMKEVLLDAEQKADVSNSVKDWVGKLKDAAYDVDDLLDELSYETLRREVISRDKMAKKVRIFFSKQNQLLFNAKMAHKIEKLRQRLEHIKANGAGFRLETIPDQSRPRERENTHSFVLEEEVIGRDVETEEVVQLLLKTNEKHNVSIDAIVGMGGLGKTMLAKSVFNHKRVKDGFELRLWVCVSEIFDVKIIVEKIIEEETEERRSGREMNSLQSLLRSQIDGKKYLLVMDDVWNEDGERWADLKRLLMGGAKGSKILITTRSERVAHVCQATSPYIVKGLSESNSWILFQRLAFKECEEPKSPNMVEIGKEIVMKCKGVPLVLRTIGRLLYFKSEYEWLSFKNKELTRITQQENEVTHILKLSYNHLPSHLKPCFAYCSLFPKDHNFEKDELINLWVAEGLVQSQGGSKCLEDVGNEYFMELIWRSIFQDVERNEVGEAIGCKLHDLMHDLAQLVAGAEYFTPNSDNERTRRILFDLGSTSIVSILSTLQLNPYKLRTILTLDSSYFYQSSNIRFEEYFSSFKSLKSLRVLKLQFLNREVPSSIGMLKHLRFLDLSFGHNIKFLPRSITKLHNLQTLNLAWCQQLKELPKDIGSLIHLRHLDISHCKDLKELPKDIGSLIHLRHLDISYTVYLRELPKGIGSLIHLRHLDISGNFVVEPLPNSITKLQFLQTLILSRCSLTELPKNIGNMVNLRFLHLDHNERMKLLPNSIAKLQKLQSLSLYCCSSLTELPRDLSNLVNLKHLDLRGCDELREMPLGLDKLTALQTMNLYVVGPSVSFEDSGLCQLNTLINIMGELRIRGLHHLRKDLSQANSVNLKDNHGFDQFSLEWNELGYNPSAFDPDFVVLEKLHPNKNVKNLSIHGYGGVKLCSWVCSLPNLTKISIVKCERMQYLLRLDQFPNLQILCLEELRLIEYVNNNEAVDEFDFVCFPSLKSLTLQNMDSLKGLWKPREFTPKDPCQSSLLPSFHCLSRLCISDCPQFISTLLHAEDDTRWEALDYLELNGLSRLASLPEPLRHSTALESLYIINCNNLLTLPDWIGNLTSLNTLQIKDCPKVTSLPQGFHGLSSRTYLTIKGCSTLEQRCTPQTGDDWSKVLHLEHIKIGKERWEKLKDERGREKWKNQNMWPKILEY